MILELLSKMPQAPQSVPTSELVGSGHSRRDARSSAAWPQQLGYDRGVLSEDRDEQYHPYPADSRQQCGKQPDRELLPFSSQRLMVRSECAASSYEQLPVLENFGLSSHELGAVHPPACGGTTDKGTLVVSPCSFGAGPWHMPRRPAMLLPDGANSAPAGLEQNAGFGMAMSAQPLRMEMQQRFMPSSEERTVYESVPLGTFVSGVPAGRSDLPTTPAPRASGNRVPLDTVTLMVRNIPPMYTQEMLAEEWQDYGFDFIYLPRSCNGHWNVGYAFVNFLSADAAYAFRRRWHKVGLARSTNKKILNISCAEVQGLRPNLLTIVKRYRTGRSAAQCEPLVLLEGVRVSFAEALDRTAAWELAAAGSDGFEVFHA